jgi:hypothetical protein
LETGKVIASFSAELDFTASAISPNGATIVKGGGFGQVYFLRLENVHFGPLLVTAWRSFADAQPAFACPHCRVWCELSDSELGIALPCRSCGKIIRLNSFVTKADWRPVARAWRRHP